MSEDKNLGSLLPCINSIKEIGKARDFVFFLNCSTLYSVLSERRLIDLAGMYGFKIEIIENEDLRYSISYPNISSLGYKTGMFYKNNPVKGLRNAILQFWNSFFESVNIKTR